MTDRPMSRLDDAALEGALRALGTAIDWPVAAPISPSGAAAGPDIATRIRARLTDPDRPRARRAWSPRRWRPLRRSVVLALAALLALAVIAGAAGLGLPGLRFLFGGGPTPPPSPPPAASASASARPTPSPTSTVPAALGSQLYLGELVSLDAVEARTGIPAHLPSDPRLGAPTTVWIDASRANQVAYVWASGPTLPETREPGIGLVLMRFDGTVDSGFYDKVIGTGTTLERVKVNGFDGYWISGDPHFFYYIHEGQVAVDEGRRWVGDALVWSDGVTTFRIESALGRDATIAIAETIE